MSKCADVVQFYKDADEPYTWDSDYWHDVNKTVNKSSMDSDDPLKVAKFNGVDCEFEFKGDGIMNFKKGNYPRLYLWYNFYNTESTFYYKRTGKEGKKSDGITPGLRSSFKGHLKDNKKATNCYYLRWRFDGDADLAREALHGHGYASYKNKKKLGEIPSGKWLGWKTICMNISKTEVLLEAWLDDKSEGDPAKMNNPNNWTKVISKIDKYGAYPSKYNKNYPIDIDINDIFNDPGMVFIRQGYSPGSLYKNFIVREIKNKKLNEDVDSESDDETEDDDDEDGESKTNVKTDELCKCSINYCQNCGKKSYK
jgi:hypothetical protein